MKSVNGGLFDKFKPASSINEVVADWQNCDRCYLSNSRKNVCVGNGSIPATVMVVGQWPGVKENETGVVYTGKLGIQAKALIQNAVGLEDTYWTNLLGCTVPSNVGIDQYRDEYGVACLPRLRSLLSVVDPYLIVAMGRVAAQGILRETSSLQNMRKQVYYFYGIPLIAVLHPAQLNRQKGAGWRIIKQIKSDMAEDMDFLSDMYQEALRRKHASK